MTKKAVFTLIFALVLILSPAFYASAVVDQTEAFYVADYAGVLSEDTAQRIIETNGYLEQSCGGAQIVVVTIEYLDTFQYTDEYAVHLFNQWGVGDDVPHIHRSSAEKGGNTRTDDFLRHLMSVSRGHRISFVWKPDALHPGVVKNQEGCPDGKNFFALHKRSSVSVVIETPYAGNNPTGFTREELLDWGKDVLTALRETLLS